MLLVTAKDGAAVPPQTGQVPTGQPDLAESEGPALQGVGTTPAGVFLLKPETNALQATMTKAAIAEATAPQDTVSGASNPVSGGKGALFAAGQQAGEGNSAAKPLAGNGQSLNDATALQAKQSAATSGESRNLTLVQKGPAMDGAALDKLRAASQGTLPEGLQNADAKGETVGPATAAAPEKEQTVAAVSAGKSPVPGLNPGEQPAAMVEAAAADGSSAPDRFAQGTADSKGLRAATGFYGTYSAARGGTEQTGSTTETTVGDAGIKTAPTAMVAKFVPFQGSAGQDGFADAGKKGQPEQKAQGGEGVSAQPQGAGLQTAAAAEAPLPEAKPVNLQSALHESILAQIKDGVVTHDDKGNGQMSIRLNPGELGELKIQVKMNDNQLHIEVQADNKMVKDLLMSNLDSLKDSLTAKNLTMSGFDVSTGGGGFNSPLPEQKGSPQQQSPLRSARAGAYPGQVEEAKVNYLTGEASNLLDVRF